MTYRAVFAIAMGSGLFALGAASGHVPALMDPSPSYGAQAKAAGAEATVSSLRLDGGVLLNGVLEGRQFAIAIPKAWNHQSLLFAHGYSMPDSSLAVSTDPVDQDPGEGLLKVAYAQGFAVGHSAYAKAGIGVQAGATATLRLERLIEALGSTRGYVSGGSMGGSIVMTLIEQHPKTFAGALSACGVTDGWEKEVGDVIDIRAAYNYFTRATAYALPGDQDLSRSALPTMPPPGSTTSGETFRTVQLVRLAGPVLKLFSDALKDPAGPAADIIRKVSSVTDYDPDPAAFVFPLVTAGLGMDDMRATFGGNIYGNQNKTYASVVLTTEENAALNRDIQRLASEPAAVRYAQAWHQTRGDFITPLVAVHNQIDPLVPYVQAQGLEAKVAAHGNMHHLTLITVPPLRAPIPGSKMQGYVHCGFTSDQMASAWSTLRAEVEK